jgi:hypothetical protein
MAYRNKTYVCFDADSDIHYYRLMQAWKQSDKTEFNFYNAHDLTRILPISSEESIKRSLRERLLNTKVFVVLIGEQTRYLYKFVRWETEQALKLDLPIIAVNLNGRRSMDPERCPPLIRNELVIHVSFNAAILQYALENWEAVYRQYRRDYKTGPYYYQASVYTELDI